MLRLTETTTRRHELHDTTPSDVFARTVIEACSRRVDARRRLAMFRAEMGLPP
jgi:hypothetical protein